MGLNPFHDYEAWQILHEARQVAARRTDALPVAEQVDAIRAELQAVHLEWMARSTTH